MANYNCYFFGPYVKVYPPKITYKDNTRTCSSTTCIHHGKYINKGYFCAICGSSITELPVTRERYINLNDFLLEELGDCDLFTVVYMDDKDYQFLISNRSFEQGGVYIEGHGEYTTPENPDYFSRKDWVRLVDKLEEKGYKFKRGVGVIAYYN